MISTGLSNTEFCIWRKDSQAQKKVMFWKKIHYIT